MNAWWQPLFQTTIDAYYVGNMAAGLSACERILSVEGLPPEIDLQTRRNLTFYTATLAELAPAAVTRPIKIPVPHGWSAYNPSIAADGERFRMVVRSANYTVDQNLCYEVNDPQEIVRTANYLIELTPTLEISSVSAINDNAVRQEPPLFPVAGFEDCRLFGHDDSWWVSATTRDHNPEGICQIALLQLEGATATQINLLSQVDRHEKNWMPIVDPVEAELRFVYSCFPTVVVRYDVKAANLSQELARLAPRIAQRFRGGTQVIPIDDGHLCLVHESVDFENGGRVYTHRWVWFDREWQILRLSAPFRFMVRGVEFAAGLARHEDDLVISYGVWDREAWLTTVPLVDVLQLLESPLDEEDARHDLRGLSTLQTASAGTMPSHAKATPVHVPAAERSFISSPTEAAVCAEITPFTSQSPSIVSMTMTGNNREIVGDALRSVVEWVDWCLLVDTGITDDTVEIAREIAGDKLIVRNFPWQDDFARARNFALAAAAETDADWAVVLDTDERIVRQEADIHALLADSHADALHVKHVGGSYSKERFFRLPVRGRYVGPTHEAFIAEGAVGAPITGVLFDEVGKSLEDYRRKAERDIAILTRYTAEHPDDPRWFYYLGDSLAGLGRYDEAIAAFRICSSLNGWDEEGAWAMYRAAECFLKLGRSVEAIDTCAAGMAKHAGLAELPWLAAYAAWQADRPAQAIYWAKQAIAMGYFAGAGASVPRVGFRHPPALWEGPYDILRFALRRLGDESGADEAEQLYEAAKATREAGGR